MGKVGFNKFQQAFFDKFSQNQHLRKLFYLTGGTALSIFYLHHRLSEDLDFFSEEDFHNELIFTFVKSLTNLTYNK